MLRRSQPEFRDVVTNFPEMTKLLQKPPKPGNGFLSNSKTFVFSKLRKHASICISLAHRFRTRLARKSRTRRWGSSRTKPSSS